MEDTREYAAIAAHYASRVARRSGVPLIRHIDEGLAILRALDATEHAARAFCLHPLVQADADLAANAHLLAAGALTDDPYVLALVFEYRHIANATLSSRLSDGRPLASAGDIPLSPLADVNTMLIADKVQNRKDFIAHHRETHPRAAELDRYFALWLERLGVTEARYAALIAAW